mmetsp:Transcript_3878/g.10983  ORF Transcript_3878/g.10983 Transcript_3878/m.10983 type:complete len:426 (+) Transcript_3878:168-1445(+)
MDETTILLVPAPGAKAEFLATVEPAGNADGASGGDLPFEVVLSSYTRDGWAMTAPPPTEPWKSTWLKSVDGRGKLPGFLKYLRERKKVPMGQFEPAAVASSGKGVIMVPFDQPPPPAGLLGDGSDSSVDDLIYCRYILDENQIGRGYRRPGPSPKAIAQQQKQKQMAQMQQQQSLKQQQQQQAKAKAASSLPKPAPKSSRASSGMLGNLMAATKRTNTQLDTVPVRKAASASAGAGVGAGGSGLTGTGAVIAQFRQDVEQKMLDFRNDVSQTCLKVPISLVTVVSDLPPEQKQSVTIDVLKYVVYEQAEEVGEDKWVAAREPSEFMDECIVAVYKEGHAPEDVLEDLNKGELPDEILQQQRAMRQALVKEVTRKETKADAQRHKETMGSGAPDDEAWTLNTQKRDRRTIEEIQKEMKSQKRQRTS